MRLQKFLANAGVCSRRAAEELIRQGRVKVDGVTVTEMGYQVDPDSNTVCVDNAEIDRRAEALYLMLNKPKDVLTTVRDTFGRTTVMDLLKGVGQRVYPVGRLDQDSEGLLLFTNDGLLTHRLLHPSHKVAKTYLVTVKGNPSRADLDRLRRGVEVEGKTTQPCDIRVIGRTRRTTILEVVLKEGRKRQIRTMFATVDHPVTRLVRTRMGPIALGELPRGKWRRLTAHETEALKKAVGLIKED